jgi:hypothetical protein
MGKRRRKTDFGAPLLRIMPKRVVIGLAIAAFAIPSLLLIAVLAWPAVLAGFGTSIGRFFFCLTISLYLAVFFFVLYPQRFVLTRIPVIDLPVTLVGPPALWVVFLLLLLALMPLPRDGRLFKPRYGPGEMRVSRESVNVIPVHQDRACPAYVVRDHRGEFVGIYVEFHANQREYEATVSAATREDIHWTFRRRDTHFGFGAAGPPPD